MQIITRSAHMHETLQVEKATDRQERISGWRQDLITDGRALLLGAGALGNEAAKNLALMGLGYMFIADMDYISVSNLSRAVFFHRNDARYRRSKAEVVGRRARALNVAPHATVQTFRDDIVWRLGGGVFRRVDVVLGCLDNVEARMKANVQSLLTGTPYLDGGILGLAGTVTAVNPPYTACWECNTSRNERNNAKSRYDSCSMLMLCDIEAGRLPTVQVASSIVAGFQTQEAVKVIQGQPWAAGNAIYYDANLQRPDLDVLTISRRPACWCNDVSSVPQVLELPLSATHNTVQDLLEALGQQGYSEAEIVFPDQFVTARLCTRCSYQEPVMLPRFKLDTRALHCSSCQAEGNEWITLLSIGQTGLEDFGKIKNAISVRKQIVELTLDAVGFPPLALVSFLHPHNHERAFIAELSADAAEVMGGSQFATVRPRARFPLSRVQEVNSEISSTAV